MEYNKKRYKNFLKILQKRQIYSRLLKRQNIVPFRHLPGVMVNKNLCTGTKSLMRKEYTLEYK